MKSRSLFIMGIWQYFPLKKKSGLFYNIVHPPIRISCIKFSFLCINFFCFSVFALVIPATQHQTSLFFFNNYFVFTIYSHYIPKSVNKHRKGEIYM